MAKRFTDTDKYKKSFMRSLPGAYKLFWDYLYHDCNHAGIWHVDFEIAQIYLGQDMLVNQETALRLFNEIEVRVVVLTNGKKWFIKPFIEFQYKASLEALNPANKVHASILATLVKEGVCKPHASPRKGAKDKDKDKDMVLLGKGGVGGKGVGLPPNAFQIIWERYPRKLGKDEAARYFKAQVLTMQDWLDISMALEKFSTKVKNDSTEEKYIPHGSTWFNKRWRDWINYVEIERKNNVEKSNTTGSYQGVKADPAKYADIVER